MIEIKPYKEYEKAVFINGEIVHWQECSDAKIVNENIVFNVLVYNGNGYYFDKLDYLVSQITVSRRPDGDLEIREITLDGKYLKK